MDFVVLNQDWAQKISQENLIEEPSILLYKNGALVTHFDADVTETSLINFISSFVNDPISSLSGLYKVIGQNPYAIIATQIFLDKAIEIQRNITSLRGFPDLIVVEPKVIREIGFDTDTLIIYRSQDSTFTNIQASDNLEKILTPSFTLQDIDSLTESSFYGDIVMIIDSNESHYDNLGDIFYELHEKHPNFHFVIGDNSTQEIVQYLIGDQFSLPYFIIFNLYNRSYYEFNQTFINDTNFIDNFLQEIETKQVSPSYMSQQIPNNTNEFVNEIVGLNYEEFVDDVEEDSVILFYTNKTSKEESVFEYFKQAAKEIKELNLPIKFGEINIELNASPKQFPFFIDLPHIHYFNTKDKIETEVFAYPSYEYIVALVKMSCKRENVEIDYIEIDESEVKELYQRLDEIKDDLPQEQYNKSFFFIKELEKYCNEREN
ncbi:hypothetical protein GPJ56_003335 [Histomonas meleagridis]|uniref:uncharacterized protein n=1 Tax=Histomonas meleagridis TaxID=135588 RepID=UPI00355A7C1F|nr:hypothetical protein GPJ56_003335 [Histomonas meleagridis]KAH0804954.1 hypothetical protein GO595_001899 [Histomonas meleagridis]